jgi:hypothetical protein
VSAVDIVTHLVQLALQDVTLLLSSRDVCHQLSFYLQLLGTHPVHITHAATAYALLKVLAHCTCMCTHAVAGQTAQSATQCSSHSSVKGDPACTTTHKAMLLITQGPATAAPATDLHTGARPSPTLRAVPDSQLLQCCLRCCLAARQALVRLLHHLHTHTQQHRWFSTQLLEYGPLPEATPKQQHCLMAGWSLPEEQAGQCCCPIVLLLPTVMMSLPDPTCVPKRIMVMRPVKVPVTVRKGALSAPLLTLKLA